MLRHLADNACHGRGAPVLFRGSSQWFMSIVPHPKPRVQSKMNTQLDERSHGLGIKQMVVLSTNDGILTTSGTVAFRLRRSQPVRIALAKKGCPYIVRTCHSCFRRFPRMVFAKYARCVAGCADRPRNVLAVATVRVGTWFSPVYGMA